MIYFFHHYELPAILQQARIQQIIIESQQTSEAEQAQNNNNNSDGGSDDSGGSNDDEENGGSENNAQNQDLNRENESRDNTPAREETPENSEANRNRDNVHSFEPGNIDSNQNSLKLFDTKDGLEKLFREIAFEKKLSLKLKLKTAFKSFHSLDKKFEQDLVTMGEDSVKMLIQLIDFNPKSQRDICELEPNENINFNRHQEPIFV